MKKRYFYLFYALIFLAGKFVLNGQIFDTRGREFWLTFLPNFHNYKFQTDPLFRYSDSLYIFIASDKPTSGTIEYFDIHQNKYTTNFTISDPSVIYSFKIPFNDFELLGFNDMGNEWRQNFNEIVSHFSFYINSESDVAVYAHNQGNKSSDAFLVLPTKALGKEYYVMTYKSDGKFTSFLSRTPSQFAIVATEDETVVEINPSSPTFSNDTLTQEVNLNKGDVYLVQSRITSEEIDNDLTGTHIISNKPIAVFAGHQRATIPLEAFEAGSSPSRDFICEQLPPLQSWGKNAFIIPFAQPQLITNNGDDIYRVLAGYDSTNLYINDEFIGSFKKGEFFQDVINGNEPLLVTADKPILVAQFKKTSNTSGASWLGDPFMMIIPPKEQFIDSCLLVNIQANEIQDNRTFRKVYQEHYLTLVVPQSAITSTKIDGVLLSQSSFQPIDRTGYFFLNLKVSEGQHYVQSTEPIGIYAYGYGPANSYGYIGGMATRVFDFNPPKISYNIDCFKAIVNITDTAQFDSGIDTIYYVEHRTNNIKYYPDTSFTKYNKSAQLTFELINPFEDGNFTVYVKDSLGLISQQSIVIEGFTLTYPNHTPNVYKQLILNFTPNIRNIFKLPILNYSTHPVIIDTINAISTLNFELETQLPLIIPPNSIDTLILALEDEPSNLDSVVIQIGNGCITENYAILKFNQSECDISEFEYLDFSQPLNINFVGEARVIDKYVQITPPSVNKTGAIWHTRLVPVVSGFKCEFSFRMKNGSNNRCNDISIPGGDGLAFVVQSFMPFAIGNYGGGIGYDGIPYSLAFEFDTFSNDSTQIENFFDPNGNHIAIQSNGSKENSSKHIGSTLIALNPNLPLTFVPDGTIYYGKITYNSKNKELVVYIDTSNTFVEPVLVVKNFVLNQYIPLERGYRAYVGFTSATGCAYETHELLSWYFCPTPPDPHLDVSSIALQMPLMVFPNPTDGIFYLSIEPNDLPANLKLSDLFGNNLFTKYIDNNLIEIDLSDFSSGTYILSVLSKKSQKNFIISLIK
ncbi:MAG: lectin-like domain-containing protein [Candidatus Kapaibacteriales bacterium]